MNNIMINKINAESNSKFIMIILILYKILLDIIYKLYIVSKWNFMGFQNRHNVSNYILSWIIFFVIIPLVIKNLNIKKVSSLFVSLFNMISFIPNLTIIGFYDNYDFIYIILFSTYWFFINFINLIIPEFDIKIINDRHNIIYYAFMSMFILIILFTSYKYTRFRIDLNIFNAYTYRSESSEYRISSFLEYLFSISRNVFPIFIVERLVKKKYLQSLLLLFVGFLAYSVTGSKSVLFSYIIVYFGYWFYRNYKIKYIPLLLVLLLFISLFGIIINKKSYIVDIVIRRVFYIPGLLSYYYYDFFSKNPFDYFRQGILGKLGFNSPYLIPIPQLIGDMYFLKAYANVGLFSDSFYNLGYIGVIIMPILTVFIIKLFESVTKNLDDRIVFAGSITAVFSFINSSFFTTLITHGVLAIIFVLYFINRNNGNTNKK